jgi:hypothetical protein
MLNFRKKSNIKQWVSYLSLLLLLQGIFPVQSHTYLVRGDDGRVVEVCTLEGIKTLVIDDNGNPVEHDPADSERSAAIAFSSLVAEALPGIDALILPSSLDRTEYIAHAQQEVFSVSAPCLKPIRAPPADSLA